MSARSCMTRSTLALVTGVLLGTSALFRPAPSKICRSRTAAGLSCCAAEAAPELLAPPEAQVLPAGCPSCEDEWLKRSKETEASEKERLASLRADDMNTYLSDIWDYAQRMNDTQRQELALTPDTMLRSFIIDSSTPPTKLLEHVYNATMGRVPYEQACYICGPEQALLLRTLVALAHPRRCLDVGSFTGYSSAAVLEALPADAEMTCIEIEPTYTALLDELLGDRATVLTGPALAHLQQFAAEGRTFDFITLDADKPLHGEYVNASIALLRPGGLIVMFGMLLFPTAEDQVNTQRPPPLPLLSLPPSTSFLVCPLPSSLLSARPPVPAARCERRVPSPAGAGSNGEAPRAAAQPHRHRHGADARRLRDPTHGQARGHRSRRADARVDGRRRARGRGGRARAPALAAAERARRHRPCP